MFSKSQQGLSLIELMIALLLSSFVVAGAIHIFIMVKKVWMTQEAIARLQENMQSISFELGSAIRNAGTLGCSNVTDISVLKIHGVVVAENLGFDTKIPVQVIPYNDIMTNVLISKGVKKRAKKGLPALWVVGSKKQYAIVEQVTIPSVVIRLKGQKRYQAGDVIVVNDCSHADIFKLSENARYLDKTDTTLIPLSSSKNTLLLSKAYATNAYVAKLESAIYFIGDTYRVNADNQPISGLFKTDINGVTQELVEGIDSWDLRLTKDFSDNQRLLKVEIKAALNSIEPGNFNGATNKDRLIHQSFQQVWQVRSIK